MTKNHYKGLLIYFIVALGFVIYFIATYPGSALAGLAQYWQAIPLFLFVIVFLILRPLRQMTRAQKKEGK